MLNPVDQLVVDWLRTYGNANTRSSYERDVFAFVSWCQQADVDPLEPSTDDALDFRLHLEALGLTPSSISRKLSACRSFYRHHVLNNNLAAAAGAGFEQVRVLGGGGDSTTPWLNEDELQALLAAARRTDRCGRDFVLTALLGLNGLRVSEAVEADVLDLGRSAGHKTLQVRRKGDRAGLVPISPVVDEALIPYLGGRRTGPLIVALDGDGVLVRPPQSITRSAADKRVKLIAEEAGVNPAISPHSLRHSFVTLSLAGGSPLHVVQGAVGHRSPGTTQRYNHGLHNLDANPTFELAGRVA